MSIKVGILGAGLAGLGAAFHLDESDYVVLEGDKKVGGVASSVKIKGFTFDYGPHIIYSKSQYVKDLYMNLLGDNMIFNGVRRNFICTLGRRIPFPFEANLRKAPARVREECILGAMKREKRNATNFADWILQTFGAGIAKYYMVPYNEKIWKYDLSKMSLNWIADRVVTPSVEDMIRGAFRAQEKVFGPNAFFWYPRVGGTGAIPEALSKRVSRIHLGEKVISVRFGSKGLKVVTSKKRYTFETILSSIPLPDLIEMIDDVPSEIAKAAKDLVFNSLCCVFVGLKDDRLPNWTAAYVPDKNINFHRLSFPKNFSPLTVPVGKGSINIEITREKGARLDELREAEGALEGLRDIGILKKVDKPLFVKTCIKRYAYVIYDLNHRRNTRMIHEFLRSRRIVPIGRFGEWEYFNTDHAFLSGQRGAEIVRDTLLRRV